MTSFTPTFNSIRLGSHAFVMEKKKETHDGTREQKKNHSELTVIIGDFTWENRIADSVCVTCWRAGDGATIKLSMQLVTFADNNEIWYDKHSHVHWDDKNDGANT